MPFDFEVAATVLNLVSMLMNVKKFFFQDSHKPLYGGIYWCRLVVYVYRERVKRHAVVRCNQVVCYYTVGDVP